MPCTQLMPCEFFLWLLQSRPKLLWKSLSFTITVEENSVFLAYLPGPAK